MQKGTKRESDQKTACMHLLAPFPEEHKVYIQDGIRTEPVLLAMKNLTVTSYELALKNNFVVRRRLDLRACFAFTFVKKLNIADFASGWNSKRKL